MPIAISVLAGLLKIKRIYNISDKQINKKLRFVMSRSFLLVCTVVKYYFSSDAGSRFALSISLKYLYVPTLSSIVAASSATMIAFS